MKFFLLSLHLVFLFGCSTLSTSNTSSISTTTNEEKNADPLVMDKQQLLQKEIENYKDLVKEVESNRIEKLNIIVRHY